MPVASNQRLEVRGPRDRKRGAIIIAGILGGIAIVFGGLDVSKGTLGASKYAEVVAGNAVIGGLIGAALAPRGWITIWSVAHRLFPDSALNSGSAPPLPLTRPRLTAAFRLSP